MAAQPGKHPALAAKRHDDRVDWQRVVGRLRDAARGPRRYVLADGPEAHGHHPEEDDAGNDDEGRKRQAEIGDGAGEKHAAKSRAAQLLCRRAAVAIGPARIGIGKSVRRRRGNRGSVLAKSRGAQGRWRRDRNPVGETPGGFEEPNDLRADRRERETAAAAS
jgi:hypothetical protein